MIISDIILGSLLKKAQKSERGRVMYELTAPDCFMQILVNVGIKDSFVPIHRHLLPAKNEVISILYGEVLVNEYDEKGNISRSTFLSKEKGNQIVLIKAGIWHSLKFVSQHAYILEMIDGPYCNKSHKELYYPNVKL